jgi:DNA-binding response OmpR family regulator
MMPKKRILLIDANEDRMGRLRFLLWTKKYAVLSASSAAEACSLFAIDPPDLVIAASDMPGLDWLLKALHDQNPFVRQIVLAPAKGNCNAIADAVLCGPPPEEMLERIKIISAGKRGPRKTKPPVSDYRTEAERIAARHQVETVLGVEMPARRIA